MKRPRVAAAVVLAHALVLWPWSCTNKAPPPKKNPPPVPAKYVLDHEFAKRGGSGGLTCDPSYTGIGVRSLFGAVYEVAPGGPAERAGIQAGDTLLSDGILGPDRYPVGTPLVLEITRSGRRWAVLVKIERICQERR